jgi:hypothetical protein
VLLLIKGQILSNALIHICNQKLYVYISPLSWRKIWMAGLITWYSSWTPLNLCALNLCSFHFCLFTCKIRFYFFLVMWTWTSHLLSLSVLNSYNSNLSLVSLCPTEDGNQFLSHEYKPSNWKTASLKPLPTNSHAELVLLQ